MAGLCPISPLSITEQTFKGKGIRQAQEMRKHLKKFFWFSLFTKRTVPSNIKVRINERFYS